MMLMKPETNTLIRIPVAHAIALDKMVRTKKVRLNREGNLFWKVIGDWYYVTSVNVDDTVNLCSDTTAMILRGVKFSQIKWQA